jgi:hypothetical protein
MKTTGEENMKEMMRKRLSSFESSGSLGKKFG